MLVNLDIDGKEVIFDTSLSWMYWYKMQFHDDPMKTLKPLMEIIGKPRTEDDEKQADLFNNPMEIFDYLPLNTVLNITWALAGNADESILKTPPVKWFKSFEHFPLDDVFMVLIPAIIQSMISPKKYSILKKSLSESPGVQMLMTLTGSESQPTTSDSDSTTSE